MQVTHGTLWLDSNGSLNTLKQLLVLLCPIETE